MLSSAMAYLRRLYKKMCILVILLAYGDLGRLNWRTMGRNCSQFLIMWPKTPNKNDWAWWWLWETHYYFPYKCYEKKYQAIRYCFDLTGGHFPKSIKTKVFGYHVSPYLLAVSRGWFGACMRALYRQTKEHLSSCSFFSSWDFRSNGWCNDC